MIKLLSNIFYRHLPGNFDPVNCVTGFYPFTNENQLISVTHGYARCMNGRMDVECTINKPTKSYI